MSALWISLSDAAVRLRLPVHEVRRMAVEEEILSRPAGDHLEVHAGAVAALVERQRPTVGGGPEIGDEAEDLYRKEQAT
ncbi:hypothetical protein [Nonomuraea rubra]|uniref:DNA-binding protein n=1 Tax=Nonomuraea rubra TaxID=46180 RepID=A0A7X0P719_9ACTN|nr:hypothetical protein [Nonomuraea rubra]MBB6556251.1 hypothetical protein [Nonomuraea rubra]